MRRLNDRILGEGGGLPGPERLGGGRQDPARAVSEFGAEPPSDDMAVLVFRATGG